MEFIKQYTFEILTLHATSSFISEMVRRWQPCCSVLKPCSYESTQKSALFHLKLIKSTQHLYDTFFNWLNVSVSETVVLLLQNSTHFHTSKWHDVIRDLRTQSSESVDSCLLIYNTPWLNMIALEEWHVRDFSPYINYGPFTHDLSEPSPPS